MKCLLWCLCLTSMVWALPPLDALKQEYLQAHPRAANEVSVVAAPSFPETAVVGGMVVGRGYMPLALYHGSAWLEVTPGVELLLREARWSKLDGKAREALALSVAQEVLTAFTVLRQPTVTTTSQGVLVAGDEFWSGPVDHNHAPRRWTFTRGGKVLP